MIETMLGGIQETKMLTAALDHVVSVENQVYLVIEEVEHGGEFGLSNTLYFLAV